MHGICYSSVWVSEGKSFENMVTDECERVLGIKQDGRSRRRVEVFFVFCFCNSRKY